MCDFDMLIASEVKLAPTNPSLPYMLCEARLKFPNQFHDTLEGAVLFGSYMLTVSNK